MKVNTAFAPGNRPLTLWPTLGTVDLVSSEAAAHSGRNAHPISLATVVAALRQTAGGVHVVAISFAAVTLVPRLTEPILAVPGSDFKWLKLVVKIL